MRNPTQDDRFICANCDLEIAHHPVFHLGLAFCCPGCVAAGPCICSYDEPAFAPAFAHALPQTAPVAEGAPSGEPATPVAPVRRREPAEPVAAIAERLEYARS